jgi:hypothetical protein
MGATSVLMAFGIYLGRGAWVVPLIILFGYVATRVLVGALALESPRLEYSVGTVWLAVAALLILNGAYLSALLFAASGAVYPVMFAMGYRIEYLGLAPILAEVFAVLALLCIGGGMGGLYNDQRRGLDVGPAATAAGPAPSLLRLSLGVARSD